MSIHVRSVIYLTGEIIVHPERSAPSDIEVVKLPILSSGLSSSVPLDLAGHLGLTDYIFLTISWTYIALVPPQ